MGKLERYIIWCLESMIPAKNDATAEPEPNSVLQLGMAQAAFGRRGTVPLYLTSEDRCQNMCLFGGSGTGKTTGALDFAVQDLIAGRGFTFVDSHDAVPKLLRVIARLASQGRISQETLDNGIVLDFSSFIWTIVFNPIWSKNAIEANRQASSMLGIVKHVWPDVAWGAQTLQLLRFLFIMLAERRLTLVDAEQVLQDNAFRGSHAEHLVNPEAREYWLYRYERQSSRMQAMWSEPVLNKLTIFLADPRIRAALSHPESDFDFRECMDNGKWLLINLNKGQLLDDIYFLAAMLLLMLQKAVFSRSDTPESERKFWSAYIDEFQSFAGPVTTVPLLNEGRKFRQSLVLLSQSLSSLDKSILTSIRTNCANQLYFRMSPRDAAEAASGLIGETKRWAIRELVKLPTGTAMLFQKGREPMKLRMENVHIPGNLTDEEDAIIDRIRKNVGRPLNLAHYRESVAVRCSDSANSRESEPNSIENPGLNQPQNDSPNEFGLEEGYEEGDA